MADIVHKTAMKLNKTNKGVGEFSSGDTVGVYVKVREGDKERVQLYRGVVIKIQGSGSSRSFTVRKMSSGVGVERTFPFMSPILDRVEVISRGKVRRSKLYFLRNLRGRAARLTSELASGAAASATGAAESTEASAPQKA
jgi:large subunit ribosomal protein L19